MSTPRRTLRFDPGRSILERAGSAGFLLLGLLYVSMSLGPLCAVAAGVEASCFRSAGSVDPKPWLLCGSVVVGLLLLFAPAGLHRFGWSGPGVVSLLSASGGYFLLVNVVRGTTIDAGGWFALGGVQVSPVFLSLSAFLTFLAAFVSVLVVRPVVPVAVSVYSRADAHLRNWRSYVGVVNTGLLVAVGSVLLQSTPGPLGGNTGREAFVLLSIPIAASYALFVLYFALKSITLEAR